MKKRLINSGVSLVKNILLSASLSIFAITTYGQCPPGDITLKTQEQVDSFPFNYPGCYEIEGNLIIKGYLSIDNLLGLSQVTSIEGNLSLQENLLLENLMSIGGHLEVNENAILPNLDGLDSLTHIGNSIRLLGNEMLTSLNGLDNLNIIGVV